MTDENEPRKTLTDRTQIYPGHREIINAGVEGDARDAANTVRLDAAEKLAAIRRELIASVCFAASDLQVLINELLERLPAPAEEGER